MQRLLIHGFAIAMLLGIPFSLSAARGVQAQDLTACALNGQFPPVSGQTGKPFAELLAATDPSTSPLAGAYQGQVGDDTVRLVVFPVTNANTRIQYVWGSMSQGEDAQAYRTVQMTDTGFTWSSGQAFSYSATRQEDGSLLVHLKRGNGSEAEGLLTSCSVTPDAA
jgi:hypothetical protein